MDAGITELLAYYWDDSDYTIESVPFGMTNLTKIIRIREETYVARIYDPQTKDVQRLQFEIELTSFLHQQSLTFAVPDFIPTKAGNYYVKLSNPHRLGAIVRYIQGETPNLARAEHVEEMGRTSGRLSAALRLFKPTTALPKLMFHHLDTLHPLSNAEILKRFLADPPFAMNVEGAPLILSLLEELETYKDELNALPQHIVHHDLLIFNLLIDPDDRMSGVLDFDFASTDLRVMELAICLNHQLQYDDSSLQAVQTFTEHYTRHTTITSAEIAYLPLLMRVYYAALLTLYVGQHEAGKDVKVPFHFLQEQLILRSMWLKDHEIEFIKILNSYCTTELTFTENDTYQL
ncbi:phosphotransferase enzyme family protein [Paenibacillus lignilyticus]|uniref:Phosphotransferase n=1 Tax=Paenibacillus lignilyticus TaxID=1172615 RepID=A0ABS5CFM4_9BACL|nr:phosphotransferase [Paenibacillus lignilyticus]